MKKTILGLWVIPTQAAGGSNSTLADLTEVDGGKSTGLINQDRPRRKRSLG